MSNKSLLHVIQQGLAAPGMFKSMLRLNSEPIRLTDGDFWKSFFGGNNFTGKTVTVNAALQLSTVWACVRLISETLSTLPVSVDRARPDGSKEAFKDHQLYYLLHTQPNADMTAAVFWQSFFASLLLHGNAYIEKRMSGNTITSLIFLLPNWLTRKRLSNGEYEYRYADPLTGKSRVISASRMWHTPGFTLDGMNGLTPVQVGANVFGSAMAADEASADTFKNALRSPGLILMDSILKDEQREQVRQHVAKVSASGGVMVLEKGVGFQQLSLNPQDAELLSSRSFNVEEICRWFRIDPSLVGHKQGTTQWGTGIEQMMIAFMTFTLRPWVVRAEQSIKKDLFSPQEKRILSAEFGLEGLLRGDSAARAAFYASMTQNGIYTRDDCRLKENLPAMGGNASVLTVQSNMLPIDLLGLNLKDQDAAAALRNFLDNNSTGTES